MQRHERPPSVDGAAPLAEDERLQLALEAGRMGTWEWTVATGTVVWSPGLEAIHGLSPGSFPGTFEAFQQDIHPEDRARVLAAVQCTLEQGEDHQIEYRIVLPDGTVRWVEGRGKLFRDAAGAAQRMIGVCMDVTERKRGEEHQKLLVGELNHRVKNTLAIVQSIAGQTLREAPEPAAFKTAFTARLAALAGAHDLLTRELWQGVDLEELVAAALAPFGAGAHSPIRIEGPPVQIPPNAAVTLSLVVHELATNAAKHGALGAPGGRVALAWCHCSQAGAPGLELAWREQGTPAAAAPAQRGFGSRLFEASARQLGGEVSEQRGPDGLELRLRFPLPESV